jgi:hexokinase
MGGTNLRVCDVTLSEQKRDFEQTQRKFKLPKEVKSGTAEQLWDFVADRLQAFLEDNPSGSQDNISVPLAFTFSFPVDQQNIRSGVLQRWTKKFNVSGVEGEDVVPQLEAALARKVS